jgi:hypothetical protein
MPVIVRMGSDTFKILQNEPRDQIIEASLDDYQRAVDAGQATPWREPAQFTYSNPLPPSSPTYQGQPLYPMGTGAGQSTGGGMGYGGRRMGPMPQMEYSPSFGAPPTYPPDRPTPLAPGMMAPAAAFGIGAGPMSMGQPALAPQDRQEIETLRGFMMQPAAQPAASPYQLPPTNERAALQQDWRPRAQPQMQPLPWSMQQQGVQPLPWGPQASMRPVEMMPLPWR